MEQRVTKAARDYMRLVEIGISNAHRPHSDLLALCARQGTFRHTRDDVQKCLSSDASEKSS